MTTRCLSFLVMIDEDVPPAPETLLRARDAALTLFLNMIKPLTSEKCDDKRAINRSIDYNRVITQ